MLTFRQLQSRNFHIRPIERSSLYPWWGNISHHQNNNCKFKSPSKAIDGLQVSGINDAQNLWVPLSTTFTRDEIPVDNDDIIEPGQLKQWKYLEAVVNQLNFEENISGGLLIGANCTKTLEPVQVLQGRNGGPYAFRTRLGWCVVGPVSGTKNSPVSCNKIP